MSVLVLCTVLTEGDTDMHEAAEGTDMDVVADDSVPGTMELYVLALQAHGPVVAPEAVRQGAHLVTHSRAELTRPLHAGSDITLIHLLCAINKGQQVTRMSDAKMYPRTPRRHPRDVRALRNATP